MTLNLTIPRQQHTDFSPRITVVGVGGAGCNAVNNMIEMGLDGVEFVVANTDAQSLQNSRAERRVQLGPHLTQGLGAGAKAEIGRAAAEEATDDLARHLEGVHMVFITAGMGGGTGTGAAPVLARMARERGVLTVGVVTKPFDFEGPRRRRSAEAGIEDLQQYVDTLIVIPNQNLFRKATERTTFHDAFRMADDVLYMGVRGVTDLMVNPGSVNLDFADIRTIMAEMGKAMMGTGEGDGDDRAVKAAEAAISNPLLEDTSMRGAKGLLINITGGLDMTLFEVDEATNRIRREVDEDANIIFGTSIDEAMNGRLRVSVVATGIDAVEGASAELPQKVVAIGGGAPVQAVSAPHHGGAGQGGTGPSGTGQSGMGQSGVQRPAMFGRGPALQQTGPAAPSAPMSPAGHPAQSGSAGPVRMPMRRPANLAPAQPVAMDGVSGEAQAPSAEPVLPMSEAREAGRGPMTPGHRPAAPSQPAGGGLRSLFQQATGLMRRQPAETGAAEADGQDPNRGAPARPQPPEEMGLEIPTFLRRQSN